MQITSKFTIAVHIITAIAHFQDSQPVTSQFLAGSVGVNPVIIRNVMSELKQAGIIRSVQGKTGITLERDLSEITLFDVYQAVECVDGSGLFRFHENPNADCPVGRNIHKTMDQHLISAQAALEQSLGAITLRSIVDETETLIGNEA